MQVKNIMSNNLIMIDKNQNICDALTMMKKNKVSRLPVVSTNKEEHKKELVGIATEKDIAIKLGSSKYGNMAPSHFHMSTLMAKDVIAVEEDANVSDVAKILLENNIGGVPIFANGVLKGLVSKSDFIDMCKGRAYENYHVKDLMTTELVYVSPEDRLVHARRVILDSHIGRLLVSDDNKLLGILTSKDVAMAFVNFRKTVSDKHMKTQIKNLTVADAMTSNVKKISVDDSIATVATKMLETGFNGYPVIDNEDNIVGIITKSDLLALIVKLEEE
ncbi:MAG: CBS domain-containing protein [Methanobrevibacter sp.]|jgi:CBS domain-containing protein|nr:CBS domain-containing protein [Candidatus Methanoflexus mossambicus]